MHIWILSSWRAFWSWIYRSFHVTYCNFLICSIFTKHKIQKHNHTCTIVIHIPNRRYQTWSNCGFKRSPRFPFSAHMVSTFVPKEARSWKQRIILHDITKSLLAICRARLKRNEERMKTGQPIKGICGRSRQRRGLTVRPISTQDLKSLSCRRRLRPKVRTLTYTSRGGNHQRWPSGQIDRPQSHQPISHVNNLSGLECQNMRLTLISSLESCSWPG